MPLEIFQEILAHARYFLPLISSDLSRTSCLLSFSLGVWRHSGGTRALDTTEATMLDAVLVQDNGQRPRAPWCLLSTCLRSDEGILGKCSLTYGPQLKTTSFLHKPLKYNKQRRFTNLQGHSNQACGGAVGARRRLSSYQGL